MSPLSIVGLVAALSACAYGVAAVPQPRSPRVRIVDGHDAQPKQFPHMASIQAVVPSFWVFESSQHLCGGTLIADSWVLTTANCLRGVPANAKRTEVVLGTVSLSSWSSQRIAVAKTIKHHLYEPEWNNGAGFFDVALVKLAAAAKLSTAVQAAALPEPRAVPSGVATLSGWGSTKGNRAAYPDRLQTADLPLLDHDSCYQFTAHADPEKRAYVTHSNLCAGSLTAPGAALCGRDGGSPLIQKAGDITTVIGVASWGLDVCGSKPYPSVFMRVSNFIDWIEETQTAN